MNYLNKDEEQRLNDVLRRFSNSESAEKIDIRLGRTIAYRGIPGQSPEIDRITPKQLENLEKATDSPKESTGSITISKGQVYQVQNGQQAETNSLQPSLRNPAPSASQTQEANQIQIQASLAELKKQNEKQQVEIAQLRELMLEQNKLLQKLNPPVKERLGNWFNQVREQVSDRIQEVRSNVSEKIQATQTAAQERLEAIRTAAKQQVQSVASRAVTGIVEATGDRKTDGSMLLQAYGQKFQVNSKLKTDNNEILRQSQEVIQSTPIKTSQAQPNQERLENSSNTVSKEQVSLEQLSEQQREKLLIVCARQQQQEELARLNPSEQADFKRLVSEKEQQYLIEFRAKKLKEEYEKQPSISNKKNEDSKILAHEYLQFKKLENNEKQAEEKRAEQGFLGTKPPDSPHDFKGWYYAGTASEEFQIRCGIVPPQNLTPHGAVWYAQIVADSKRAEAEKLIGVAKEQLKKAGFSPEQIQQHENAIHKQAFGKVNEDWKKERTETLAKWQESKAIGSIQKFNVQQEHQQPQNKAVEVKTADLQAWRKEAQELGRSQNHLEKIDRVVNSVKVKDGNSDSIKINEQDCKAMQRDRSEFKQQPEQTQTEIQVQAVRMR